MAAGRVDKIPAAMLRLCTCSGGEDIFNALGWMGKHTTGTAYFVMRCFSFAVKPGGPFYKQLIAYVIIGQSGIRGLRSCTVDCRL